MTATEAPAAHSATAVDGASLAVLRVAYGALLFALVARFALRGWIHALYIAPRHLLPFWGFGWLPRPGAFGLYALFASMALAALAVVIGWRTRVALVVFALGFTWVELLDRTHYLNHYYFLSVFTLLMAALPVSWRAEGAVPSWALAALRLQVGLVYFFAGVAKLQADWLLHAEPLRTWLLARADTPVLGPLFGLSATAYAMSWAAAVFDLSAPFALSHRATRPWAFGALVVFHALTGWLFPIGMFPWIMVVAGTVFFEPGWPRRWVRGGTTGGTVPGLVGWRRVTLGLHFVVQIALPLRVYLYPGDPRWTEQGFRYGWRVMVVEKAGDVAFRVHDPASGRRWQVGPLAVLSPLQARRISATPDALVAAAQCVRDDFARRGVPGVEVRVDAWASMQGRVMGRLIDPTVDLARVEEGLRPAPWILPTPPRR